LEIFDALIRAAAMERFDRTSPRCLGPNAEWRRADDGFEAHPDDGVGFAERRRGENGA
jgi:hypothetical protein